MLCVDEKSQIQALDRTQPILPMRPGLPEKATHDYKRNGTTTLFAALEVATGTGRPTAATSGTARPEFLDFLKQVAKAYPRVQLHVVLDNYHTHKHPDINAWLAKNPRITLHFTPTSGSWLNLVEMLLRDHHPPSHPPRHLRQRQATRHRDPRLHRRLERPLPAVHLDQDRRRDPPRATRQPTSDARH